VADASNGRQAITLATHHRPHVVLLDVRMPGTDGLTALPELSRLAPVMMLTYSREPEVVAEALRRGASGYLVHGEFTAAELIKAVRDLKEGRPTLSASVSSWSSCVSSPLSLSYELSYEPSENSSHVQPVMTHSSKTLRTQAALPARRAPSQLDFGLSSREVEVMDLIATGMNNQQIAATCFISEKTVKNHINRIFAKLHSSSRSEAIAHWLGTARQGWTR
jgi:DNA-binding NarL/FixJ family response regulator